jgi:uncharacterized membrane protein YfcA
MLARGAFTGGRRANGLVTSLWRSLGYDRARRTPGMWSEILVVLVSVVAGAIGSVTGFGIGSLLTPLLAMDVGTRLAVAAVSVPHVIGTAMRFALLGGKIDRRVFWNFGLTCAVGGLAGALLQGYAANRALMVIFGGLLIFAGLSELAGWASRMRFEGAAGWLAGLASGFLGGLVGNQGGIRSAALLGFNLPKHELIGTATAIALMVDGARLPIYLATQFEDMRTLGVWVALATAGVVAGTLVGHRLLTRIPERIFRSVLAVTLLALGSAMVLRA